VAYGNRTWNGSNSQRWTQGLQYQVTIHKPYMKGISVLSRVFRGITYKAVADVFNLWIPSLLVFELCRGSHFSNVWIDEETLGNINILHTGGHQGVNTHKGSFGWCLRLSPPVVLTIFPLALRSIRGGICVFLIITWCVVAKLKLTIMFAPFTIPFTYAVLFVSRWNALISSGARKRW
jgi:hypothetical protein